MVNSCGILILGMVFIVLELNSYQLTTNTEFLGVNILDDDPFVVILYIRDGNVLNDQLKFVPSISYLFSDEWYSFSTYRLALFIFTSFMDTKGPNIL